jgi:excinuclease ABC subunit C
VAGCLPTTPGVYRFRDSAGRVLYIGRATHLRQRVTSYWGNLNDRAHLAPMVAAVAGIEAVSCASVHEAAWLERNLLEERLPRWNRTPGGQETPVCIRLDSGAETPGLAIAYHPHPDPGATLFGPYLGGVRVRQAIAALHRVLPLSYTGGRLHGVARDLARNLGVTYRDRDRLAATLTAILRRDADAVAEVGGTLLERRDQATATLAFELAARIQAEIDALAWITCTQRATVLDHADLDVHGWADGVLVGFRVRAGRLCEWSQRPCSRSAANTLLATTPTEWAGFAQHNAVLAAGIAHAAGQV